ncbi:hypothetical protein ACNPQM_23045 [Streptomyces sp. NPDC056231]|uniref:hypothetical protein n=1 Tax=Streptomyces sp. NPDC056231 TaxID=3345755 RepID=UPI003AAFC0C0
MKTRTVAVTAAAVGAAVIATTGITYASAAGSTQAAPSYQQAAPAVQQAAPDAAPLGGEGGGNGGGGKGNEGGGYGGYGGNERGGKKEFRFHREGRIFINERSYSARGEDGCITVVSGLGSKSFNVRNDSRRTVEFFQGATCDNGSPVATVGPWSTSNNVFTHRHIRGGVKVRNGVVGSFRVVRDHWGDRDDRGGRGDEGYGGEW